jgi:hypothetical protein
MKAKTAVTALLILFVAASVGFMILKRGDGTPTGNPSGGREKGDRLIAYYFHGTTRCQTCRTIEAYAEEAIRTGYPDEIASGKIQWRTVNVEEPGNEHFVRDFELVTRSVVLVHMKDGTQVEWKRLDKVWNLVHDKEAFVDYIYENADPLVRTVR